VRCDDLSVSTVLIRLQGGESIVRRDDGEIIITPDADNDRGQRLRDRNDFRPVTTWLDPDRCLAAGRLPPGAISAEITDDRGQRIAATANEGVYAAILEQPSAGREPPVCCRDRSGTPVQRPLPADWTRTRVTDAQEQCPACGALDYDEVLPTDESRGGRGGHGHDGPHEPCRIVVCRRCGHEEGAGTSLFAYTSPDDEDEDAKADRIARHRAEARVQKWYSDTMTLRGVTFPIYAAERWHLRITGSGAHGDELTNIKIGHLAEETDDPFAAPELEITTALPDRHDHLREQARETLESWISDDDANAPFPHGLSDSAIKLWFAARSRARRAAVLTATESEEPITVDGSPQPFLTLRTPTSRWVAVRRHDNLTITITIAAHDISPPSLTLEPIPDPAHRLLGPQPSEPPDD
jgi:hypothetical protein